MKIRKHRGSLADSMATVRDIPLTIEAVVAFFQEDVLPPRLRLQNGDIVFQYRTYDDRIGWDTYSVISKNEHWQGGIGFADRAPMSLLCHQVINYRQGRGVDMGIPHIKTIQEIMKRDGIIGEPRPKLREFTDVQVEKIVQVLRSAHQYCTECAKELAEGMEEEFPGYGWRERLKEKR